MSDVTKVGRRVAEFQYAPPYQQYTKVILEGPNTRYIAGTDTGRTLTGKSQWASLDRATALLNAISGYIYQPYSASDALLDPAAELGDAVSVNGYYSVIADINMVFDALCASDIAAPGGGELQSEYPYLPQIQRQVEAAQSTANSAVATANTALNTAEDALETAEDVDDVVSGWTYSGTTKIDGSMIQAGTVRASELQGGTVQLLNASGTVAGDMSITGATSANFAISLDSKGALSLSSGSSSASTQISGGGAYILLQSDEVRFSDDIRPNSNNGASVGTSSYKWSDIYCSNAQIQTSDAQVKKDISYDISAYDDFIAKLKPVTYKFVDGHRTHLGFIAQDIEQALAECGIDTEDFAGFIKSPREGGGYDYALRYAEFIALQQYQIQKLEARIQALEEASHNGG